MRDKPLTATLAAIALSLLWAFPSQAKLNVVASNPDLGSIAREVGGDRIEVTSLAKGTEDPHLVDAKPSFIRILNHADVLIEGGADLDVGGLPPLARTARSPQTQLGRPGR